MRQILALVVLLTAGLSAWGQVASLDDQAKCAEQAEKVWRKEVRSYRSNNSTEADITFTSHYNPKLGSCFVEIAESTDHGLKIQVKDAFEGSTVALLFHEYLAVVSCEVDGVTCHDPVEFHDQVATKYGVKP